MYLFLFVAKFSIYFQFFKDVGSPFLRSFQRFLASPLGNVLVMARKQHFGHLFSLEFLRARVDRPPKYALGERVRLATFLVAEGSVHQPDDSIREDHGRQFAPAYDEIAYGNLHVDLGLTDALVDSLVVPADEHQVVFLGKFLRNRVGEGDPVGRKVDDLSAVFLDSRATDGLG